VHSKPEKLVQFGSHWPVFIPTLKQKYDFGMQIESREIYPDLQLQELYLGFGSQFGSQDAVKLLLEKQ
jgi:hypothetical protein